MTSLRENKGGRGRRWGGPALAVLAVAILAALPACEREAERKAPGSQPAVDASQARLGRPGMNVLFVSVDTTRADALGCYGNAAIKTPNIDRLASEGTRFAWCISSAPLTLVSHSSMMTGSYQFVHGARDNGIFLLNDENTTLSEIFRGAGYVTGAEVATVILNKAYGLDQGFDTYGDVAQRGPQGLAEQLGNDENADDGKRPPVEPNEHDHHTERQAESITAAAVGKLKEYAQGGKPFFLFLHYYDPHQPFDAPEPFSKTYADPYFAELAYFDEQFGKVIDTLRELDLAKDTLVVFTSDHGEGRGQHGEYTHSCFLYDATQHVPLILWSPGQVPAGQVVETQVRLVDLAPTVVEFTGLKTTPQMQGQSLLPLVREPSRADERHCYGDTFTPKHTYGLSPQRMLRADGWKYILAPQPELYNLTEDRLELINRVDMDPQRAAEMRAQLRELIAQSPPPPGGRAASKEVDEQELKKLAALGYIGDTAGDLILGQVDSSMELDHFEPEGGNPRDHIEVIETLSLAMGAFRAERFEETEKLARRLLELAPDNASGLTYLGSALSKLKRFDEAIEVFRRAVEIRPERWRDQRLLGTIYAQLGRHAEAEQAYLAALEHNVTDPVTLLNLGQLLVMMERYDDALKHLTAAIALAPDSLDGHFHMGVALGLTGQPAKAVESFRRVVEIRPSFVPAHRRLAKALRESGQGDEAIAHIERTIESLPQEAALYQILADCYTEQKDLEKAGELLAKAVQLKPEQPQFHSLLGLNLVNRGRIDDSLKAFAEAVRLEPKAPGPRVRLAAALLRAGKSDEAVAGLKEALEASPEEAQLHRAMAQCYSELGQMEPAIEHHRRAVELNPESADARWDLANALKKAGRTEESVEHFRKAVELKPRSGPALAALADALEASGAPGEALQTYRTLLEVAPRFADAYPSAAHLFDQQGKADEAVELLKRGAELLPDNPVIANDLAWRLATSADSNLVDGAKAVELAERANSLSGGENVAVLDTLAAAYAAAGRFDDAVKIAGRAIELARQANEPTLASRIESRLELYSRKQTYRSDG